MDIIDQAENIINSIDPYYTTLDALAPALYLHLLHDRPSITLDLSPNSLKEFSLTPLGRLWILMVTKPTPSNHEYFRESIKILRKIISNAKTLSDASVLSEPPVQKELI